MKTLQKYCVVTTIFFVIVSFCNLAIAQDKPEPPKPEPKVQRIAGLNTKFIVALISDGENGAWIGTEDEGVFHYQADGNLNGTITKKFIRLRLMDHTFILRVKCRRDDILYHSTSSIKTVMMVKTDYAILFCLRK